MICEITECLGVIRVLPLAVLVPVPVPVLVVTIAIFFILFLMLMHVRLLSLFYFIHHVLLNVVPLIRVMFLCNEPWCAADLLFDLFDRRDVVTSSLPVPLG